jgi:proline dehydrogenase
MKAAKNVTEVLERVRAYNAQGIACSVSYLPVPSLTKWAVRKTVTEYESLLQKIVAEKLDADVTVKPQQFGTNISHKTAINALTNLVEKAHSLNIRVWLDQELRFQIKAMHAVAHQSGPEKVGICAQAFRKRSAADVESLAGFPIRLVKGFYYDHDIKPWAKVTANYSRLMDEIAEKSSYPCFATHDPELIEKAKTLLDKIGKNKGEIQFFAGVRDDLTAELVQAGYRVRIYVPYGRVFAFMFFGLPIFDRVRALKRILGYKTIT